MLLEALVGATEVLQNCGCHTETIRINFAMTSVSGLHVMQKNKQKSKVFLTIVSFALAAVLFFAAWISAAEKDKQKSELKGENENPIKEEIKKEKVVKPPRNFVPTEKVTADQAVAFPSDI
jgi:hypothetical protein